MLILKDSSGNEIKAYKCKEMTTESYDYSEHHTKSGTIANKGVVFHHYNYGRKFYFINEENDRWYYILPQKKDSNNYNLDFMLMRKIRE
jgi:hypothetical protein